jgi:putative glycosyltransferase
MRVLITDTALTPYAHAYYKKLALSGCDIFLLLPEKKSDTGQNVREYEGSEIPYRIGYSQVRKMWYGKNGMVSLRKFLIKEIPDVLVLTWPYYIDLYFNRRIIHIMAQRKIRLVIREIPFQLPRFGELDYFIRCPSYDEDLNLLSRGFLFRFRAWLTMYIRRFVYRKADAYIGYYSHARDILESYGLRKDAFFYGNTTDTDLLLSIRKQLECIPPILGRRQRILHIGRLVKWKKVELLILAFSLIVKEYRDCELVIVGEGPEKGSLSRMAVNLGLSDKILFTGAIYDPMELGQYMRGASLYVLAGMGGLSINDAMCFSLPIICSVCDGTERDLVRDGVNGFFFKENDVVDLSQKMYLILSNPPMAEEMGKKSLQIIMERANIDTFTKMYRSALDYAMQADAN